MKLRRTLDVTSDHCAKVQICQGDGPYDQPLLVQLSDVEFIMGDIPITADKMTFDWDAALDLRTFVLTQNARVSHISFGLGGAGASDNYNVDVYVTYPEDATQYPIDTTGVTLNATTTKLLWTPPANNLVFPAGSAIVLDVTESGGGPYNGYITAYIVQAPAVI